MWSGDPPVKTSKQRGSGGSIRQTRPDKPGPGLRCSHCLLCRHTTEPQSLPSKLVFLVGGGRTGPVRVDGEDDDDDDDDGHRLIHGNLRLGKP